MRRAAKLVTTACVLSLAVAACGSKPSESSNDAAGTTSASATDADDTTDSTATAPPTDQKSVGPKHSDYKACMVSDAGGFDDKSFNQVSYKGLTDAVQEFGISKAQIESESNSDYEDNIEALVKQDCDLVVTVGFLLVQATLKAAKKHPDVHFAIVDHQYTKPAATKVPNLKGLIFNTGESAFLAGYLAAGLSKTGVVGEYGGLPIPPVQLYMDGFWEGVQHYNKVHQASVEVAGWNEKRQQGLFIGDFEDKNKGKVTAENLMAQGADILFPAAGNAGLGALQAAKDSGGKVNVIWLDADGCVSTPTYCEVIVTSSLKRMDLAVKQVIKTDLHDQFTGKPYVGTLENGGVGLAPYHQWSSKVPEALQQELEKVKQQLVDGEITVKSTFQPK